MAKLLLVDDDVTLLRFMQEFLEEKGYDVLTASSGGDGLRLAYREHPDLAVLDVMMPGMDGWEVTSRLRQMSDIPIILVTGKTTEADKLRGFNLGVDDYVTKPFSFAELAARIGAVLNRVRQAPARIDNLIQIGDLMIDLSRREVRQHGQPVTLTPTEYRLLEVLARRMGEAVAEVELIHQVWGQTHQEETAVVRRYIWLLRQKLEEDPANPRRLVTVRGYGYRLDAE